MSDTKSSTTETADIEQVEPADEQAHETGEVIEVSWEQAEELYQLRAALKATESQLSWYLLECEKNKANLLERTRELESAIYSRANTLRENYNISPNLTYELKLPQSEGEKSYFIRKEE